MTATRTAMSTRRWLLPVAAAATTALLAGCTGGSADGGSGGQDRDSVSYALPVNFTPNWILPLGTAQTLNTNNRAISSTLWEPLITYDGSTGTIAWNKDASIATDAEFAADGTSVTITLGDRTWSDGEPITARDVEFWYNLVTANKESWGSYNEGQAPDDWASFETIDDTHFVLTFDKAYNPDWMLANQLSLITPLPQHAWGKTGADAEVTDDDRTPAGAQAIWAYLNSASEALADYDSEELWTVVSGPYALGSFSTAGEVVLEENDAYDGGEVPTIPTVNLLPFASSDAEENALRSGELDYGYISASNVDQSDSFTELGYQVEPWSGWSITYMPYNFENPGIGPVVSQLYARQAVQMSVDQDSLAEVVFNGTAVPGYGPVPQAQDSDFLSDTQADNPYPYSTEDAAALLAAHGWEPNADGIMVCADAGTEADQCGAGVAEGTVFALTVLSQSGSTVTDNMMSEIQSSLRETGIDFSIETAPVSSVLSQTPACESTSPDCDWQLSFFGTAGSWYFNAFPTGDSLFQTGGSANFGSYSNPEVDALISAATTSTDNETILEYSATLAEDLPVIWLPSPNYQVSVINESLVGFQQDSLAQFHPAQWSWTE